MMFGDALLSDHDSESNSWSCLNIQRLDSIYFWYAFRTTLPFVWPSLFVGTFLVPYFFFNHSDGYIFMGSILSAVFCILSLLSFWQIRPWRRHPSILMIMICFISIVISCILVYNAAPHGGDREIDKSDVNVIQDSHFNASDRSPSCLLMSFFIQLTLLAREGWILTLSLDLLTSITNPFASYKSSLKQYHFYIWSFTVLSAIVLISTKSCQGEFLSNGTCWIRISGAESACFWGFFMAWVITFYVNAAAVLTYAFSRVSKGLESTYETRYACVADTFRVVFLYFIYGMIIAVFFLVIYYSYQSGLGGEHLYFLEHCFAYLIACRGFVDALIWFFSHGFMSERKGTVTNLAAVVATDGANSSSVGDRRQSSRSSPAKSSSNRYPFTDSHHVEGKEQMAEAEGDLGEKVQVNSDDQFASGNAKRRRHLLTLTDIFLPDQSLRSFFTNIFFGKPTREYDDGMNTSDAVGRLQSGDEECSIHATRKAPKKRRLWSQTTSPDTDMSTLADALLVNSPYHEADEESSTPGNLRHHSRSHRQRASSDDDENEPSSVVSRITRDTYDVDVSPQLNLTLRREVLSLVTRGIQESVTRMIERDSQLRNQLAKIGVTVLDERDYFQEVPDEENSDESDVDEVEEQNSESEGYDSSSSIDHSESSASNTSIHSLLSSQHSARSTGLIPAPASALPSSLIAARRVQPIQRVRSRPQEKDRNKSNRTSNSSQSRSKKSRQSDSNGSKSKTRGKSSNLSSDESKKRTREATDDKVSSSFADLTAAHRAGVAPIQSSTASIASIPSQHETGGLNKKTEGGVQSKRSQRLAQHHSHHYQRSHHSSQHIPSNIHLTNVNHSFHYGSPAQGADAIDAMAGNTAAAAAFTSSSMSSSFESSPLHPQRSMSHYHPSTKDSMTPSRLKYPASSDTQNLSMNLRAPVSQHNHFEINVIQNLMSIVGGQYYPGEYGVDNIEPAAIVPSVTEQSYSFHHQKHQRRHYQHHHSVTGSAHLSSSAQSSSRVSMSKSSLSLAIFAPINAQQHQQGTALNYSERVFPGGRETSHKKRQKSLPKDSKIVDEEHGRSAATRDPAQTDEENLDGTDHFRQMSQDSQASNASSQASNASSHSTSSSFSNPTNSVLRRRKQSMLNEFRPPAIVVFYFDEQRHRFRDFRPATFRQLRSLAGISEEDYLRFISQPAQERLSEGRSGAFFFICGAGELVVKTIAQSEAKTLLKILDQYRLHFVNNPESLIVRFLGLHSITLYGTEFYFVVMKNIFPPGQRLQERYDLKGSYIARHAKVANRPGSIATCRHCGAMFVVGHGLMEQNYNGGNDRKSSGTRASGRRRSSGMHGGGGGGSALDAASTICPEMASGHEPSVTLKDNDLTSKIRLHPEHALQVIDTLFNDSDALASMGLMDYSLLVGVQHVHYDLQDSSQSQSHLSSSSASSSSASSYRSYPARVVIAPNQYYFGIIDILQTWDYTKRFENFVKVNVLGHPYDGISAIPPQEFKHRFQRKIASVIDHAALIREVTGSWQGKREVGNVYSLTSLPQNMSVVPHNWSIAVMSNVSNTSTAAHEHFGGSRLNRERVKAAEAEDSEEDGDGMNNLVDDRDSLLLRESLTSRHSLIMSADQGAAAADYQPTLEPPPSMSPTTALRHVIADRNSFHNKSFS
jgi:1-phosphatidylinositol-4-phosphate 5-kinase